jgi:hypothetical protein
VERNKDKIALVIPWVAAFERLAFAAQIGTRKRGRTPSIFM